MTQFDVRSFRQPQAVSKPGGIGMYFWVVGIMLGGYAAYAFITWRSDQPSAKEYQVMRDCRALAQVHFTRGDASVADWGIRNDGRLWCRLHSNNSEAVSVLDNMGDQDGDLWGEEMVRDCKSASCEAELRSVKNDSVFAPTDPSGRPSTHHART